LAHQSFFLPETLYRRDNTTGQSQQAQLQSWIKLFTFNGGYVKRQPRLWDFTHIFTMLTYHSVALPAFGYSISFGLRSVLFAVTGAAAFGSIYHFNTAEVGMAIGLSTLIGTMVGELAADPISDLTLLLYTKRQDGRSKPETRLQAMWPAFIILPTGIAP
jgi:hypothetical protein